MATIIVRGKWLHISFYHPIKKREWTKPTGCPDTRDGWKDARKKLKAFEDTDLKKMKAMINKTEEVGSSTLFSTAFKKYLELQNFAQGTIINKTRAKVALIDLIGDKPIVDYSLQDFQRFNKLLQTYPIRHYANKKERDENNNVTIVKGKFLEPNTISIRTKDIRAIFNFFLLHEWIEKNYAVKEKEIKKEPKAIDPCDELELLQKIKEKNINLYNAVFFMLNTGFRATETAKLEWKNVYLQKDPPSIKAYNKVTKDEELVPMLSPVYELLKGMNPKGDKTGRVFNFKNKDSFSTFDRIQKEIWKERRYTLHNLRKTFITQLLEATVPLEDVKELSRHSSKSMEIIMDHYRQVKAKRLKEITDQKFTRYKLEEEARLKREKEEKEKLNEDNK